MFHHANYTEDKTLICSLMFLLGHLMLESLKVMLLCGSDLLKDICKPGVWIPEQVSQGSIVYKLRFVLSIMLTIMVFFLYIGF